MIINKNINALHAWRTSNINNAIAGKSMKRLSSGLRINAACDDAAGLSISEKMRGQIRGFDQAARNVQNGISLIQTAEGALTEVNGILQRMRELAVQSASDTNNIEDRMNIQAEINQLTSEINQIGNTIEYNSMKILAGEQMKNPTAAKTEVIIDGKSYNIDSGEQNASIGNISIIFQATSSHAAYWSEYAENTLIVNLHRWWPMSVENIQDRIRHADTLEGKPEGLDMTKFTFTGQAGFDGDGKYSGTAIARLSGGSGNIPISLACKLEEIVIKK